MVTQFSVANCPIKHQSTLRFLKIDYHDTNTPIIRKSIQTAQLNSVSFDKCTLTPVWHKNTIYVPHLKGLNSRIKTLNKNRKIFVRGGALSILLKLEPFQSNGNWISLWPCHTQSYFKFLKTIIQTFKKAKVFGPSMSKGWVGAGWGLE